MQRLHVASGGRYPVLRALAILQVISAFVIGIGGIVGAVYLASLIGKAASFGDRILITMGGLAATFFLVIFALAFAELIKLLIDVEHNTRMASINGNGNGDGNSSVRDGNRLNRAGLLDGEETAEGALLRGH